MCQDILRCDWAGTDSAMTAYHDREWGVPVYDDRGLFEMLLLEGAQAGLSWSTILRKRESYRSAFCDFDPERVAGFGQGEVLTLLGDAGLVRNRLKIQSAVRNARAVIQVQQEHGSLSAFLWSLVGGEPKVNHWRHMQQIPASTEESAHMSRVLKRRGFSFVGPTICYAFMQATGMVNDHLVSCFRHPEAVPNT